MFIVLTPPFVTISFLLNKYKKIESTSDKAWDVWHVLSR